MISELFMKTHKIGIYGGTFNPIHSGHVRAAIGFYNSMELDLLYIIPNSAPPHKSGDESIDSEHRIKMAELAFSEYSEYNISVSDIEIKRGGKSFTRDTISQIKEEMRDAVIYFLIGTDMFLTLDKWRYPDYLFDNCKFVLFPRSSGDLDSPEVREKRYFYLDEYDQWVDTIALEPFEVSSTKIRSLIHEGKSASDLLPDRVHEYIIKNSLYQ